MWSILDSEMCEDVREYNSIPPNYPQNYAELKEESWECLTPAIKVQVVWNYF